MKKKNKSWWQKLVDWVEENKWLMLILILVVFLRIPTLFEPHRYADEEIYLTLGQGVRQGLTLYRDIHDNKPPFLYLTAAIAGNVFGFRFILMIANLINIVLVWKLAELMFDKKRLAVIAAAWLFGIFSTIPMFEGNIANGENFMIVPLTAGAWWLYRVMISKRKHPWWEYLSIGVLFSIAFLYKVPAVFDFMGLMICWWLLARPKEGLTKRWRFLIDPKVWLVIIGFLAPIGISIGYYAYQGAFEPYVRAALLQNVGYVSSWRGSGSMLTNPLVWRGLIVMAVIGILWKLRKKLFFEVLFVGSWLVFSMYGALLSSRPYPHYLLEVMVPMALIIPMVVSKKKLIVKVAAGLVVLMALAYWENGFWYYKSLPYYQNFGEYIVGKKSKQEFFDFWQGVARNYEIGEYVKKRTMKDDNIFVWGTEPTIYSLTERLPVGRYAVEYHVVDFKAFDETIRTLEKTPPEMVIVFPESRDFAELEAFLAGDSYIWETTIKGVRLYRHVNGLKQ